MISHLLQDPDKPFTVMSLTTVSCPHRGSPVIDWIYEHVMTPDSLKAFARRVLFGLDGSGFENLTTAFCTNEFNPRTPNDPSVAYYSYGASREGLPSSYLSTSHYFYHLVYERQGPNDGIVSVHSAKWGTYVSTLRADHFDLTDRGWSLSERKFDAIRFYLSIADMLHHQGF